MLANILCPNCRHADPNQKEVVCGMKTDHATALVLSLLGICMLYVGTYLLFGPIGTIPASLSGFSLSLAGSASLISSIVIVAKEKI
ncbi:MAG: hypothetical protein JJU12_04400 [Chlamydiales bacterium]|nr:hypothetical protein [Chlamydiales bacterium]